MSARPAAGGAAADLGPIQRREALVAMADTTFDLVVIGGGVTGCGIALDAATRGLSVALVEKDDLASGTSSRSGKLVHGGLRYLEQLNVGLVRQALAERALMLRRLCPHLVKPIPFIYPLEHRLWERPYVGAGLVLYDTIGGAGAVPHHRHLSKRGALRLSPSLRADGLTGAISFYDAQVDDARHTVTVARTAAGYGAVVASQAEAVGFVQSDGRIHGVKVVDRLTGAEIEVQARGVISAAGPWTEQILATAGRPTSFGVTASKGVHIVVPRARIRSEAAILVRAEDSVLFVRPWDAHWLIGTTDTTWEGGPDRVTPTLDDIDYLLRNVNRVVSSDLGYGDVVGAWAGLRPLVSAEAATTSRLSREHDVSTPIPGLTVVAGGKYTTYRVMAADAVDAATADRAVPASVTDRTPLLGADGLDAIRNSTVRLATQSGLTSERVERLVSVYGATATDLLTMAKEESALSAPIPGADKHLMVEAVHAVRREGALHLTDILARRIRITYETDDAGATAAPAVAAAVASTLGWDRAAIDRELHAYRSFVASEQAWQPKVAPVVSPP
jgi:glycerol-3-phosphate dehydrogenase